MNTGTQILRFRKRSQEAGQAIVLIALMMVVLVASVGLAIDGGGMFLLWRDAQNAVDSAALQAAFAYCTSNSDFDSAIEAGLKAADDNGFDNNSIDNWVTIIPAPSDRRPSNVPTTDLNSIMLVTIRAYKPSYFIQVVYGGPLEVTVDTIGICSPAADSIFEGYSTFAMGSNELCGWDADDANPSHAQIAASGSNQNYFGPWFTNGNAAVGGGGGGITFYDGAGVDVVGGLDGFDLADPNGARTPTNGVVTTNPTTQITSFPTLFTIDQFANAANSTAGVDGQYYLQAKATGSQYANVYNTSASNFKIGQTGVLEGLYVNVGGPITVANNAQIGPKGVTVVALGEISGGGVDTSLSGASWQPFVGGVTMFSLYDRTDPNCNVSGGGSAISFSADRIIGFGILYAPNGGITMSSSNAAWCGAMIANAIDRSGSKTWIFGERTPSEAELLSYVAQGLPSEFVQYHDRSCDYINDPTPPYYGLGD